MDYRRMYALLICEIDNALTMMDKQDFTSAYQTLLKACETCEEEYIRTITTEVVTSDILKRLLGYCIANQDRKAYKALRAEFGFTYQNITWDAE